MRAERLPRGRRWSAPAPATALVCAVVLATALAGCTPSPQPGAAEPAPVASPSATAPSATPDAPTTPTGQPDYAPLCEANRQAAVAKAGTVADDLAATRTQEEAIAALLPLTGVDERVAAGAEVFADSLAETIGILQEFPADAIVADIGTDPRFLEADALAAVGTNPDYQAFIGWAIEECFGLPTEE